MKKIKFHSSLHYFLKTQLLFAVLIFLTHCAEHKKKERLPIEEKQQTKKRDKLTLTEAEAVSEDADVFSLNEEEENLKKKKLTLSQEELSVSQKPNENVSTSNTNPEDRTKPIFSLIEIKDNVVIDDTIHTLELINTDNPTLSADIGKTLKDPNPTIKDSTNNISVHLTNIDLDKNKTAEKKKMFVQLETRILFDGGTFELSSKYKERLNGLIRDIEDEIKKYRAVNPDEELVLMIQVKGYADKKSFYVGQDEKERQQMNNELSNKRAKVVTQYLKQGVNQPGLEVEEIVNGLGEELPLGVYESPELEDQNRRSCSIYLLICSQK